MVAEPVVGPRRVGSRRHRLRTGGMVSDPAYALGPTILAAVGYVLHPAASGLGRVAADLDRRAAVDADSRLGPARCPPLIPGERIAHRDAAAGRPCILEVHRHLRNLGDDQRRPRALHVLGLAGTDHSLAAVAQPADGRRLAEWHGLLSHAVRQHTRGQPGSAHSARRHVLHVGFAILGARGGVILRWAGLLHGHLVAAVRPDNGLRTPDPASHGLPRIHLRDHCDGLRLPHRAAADPAQFPERAAHGLLSLRSGADPRQLREHRVLPRRAGGERRADGPLLPR